MMRLAKTMPVARLTAIGNQKLRLDALLEQHRGEAERGGGRGQEDRPEAALRGGGERIQ